MKCRILKDKECEITQNYINTKDYKHLAVDVVKTGHKLDYIIAHSGGTVIFCQDNLGYLPNSKGNASYGNCVKIDHGNGYATLYAHMKKGLLVKNGQKVKKSQRLGYMSDSGNTKGSHLHFEVWRNGVRINPTNYLDSDLIIKDDYKSKCNYKTLADMYVRWGAGLNYGIKLVKDLTLDGKKNSTSSNPYSYAVYKKGTIYTALDIIKNSYGVWARTPSGYVCMEGASTIKYASKV